mgnify:CR=1 FL=1
MQGFTQFCENNFQDLEIIQNYLHRDDLSVKNIAVLHGKSEAEIYRILQYNGINPNRQKIHHEKVQNLSNLGWGIKEISNFTGYSTRNVRYILKKPTRQDGNS